MAYYADKNGKPTAKGKEWVSKKKKEKIKKLRELAEKLKPEEKEKVTNSEPAKQMERKAIKSGIFAGIAGIGAGLAAASSSALNSINSDDAKISQTTAIDGDGGGHGGINLYVDGNHNYTGFGNGGAGIASNSGSSNKMQITTKFDTYNNGGPWQTAYSQTNIIARITDSALNIISMVSSLIFGAMWGSLIVAGVQGVKAGIQGHKANVMRREEILQQLMQSKKKE